MSESPEPKALRERVAEASREHRWCAVEWGCTSGTALLVVADWLDEQTVKRTDLGPRAQWGYVIRDLADALRREAS